MSDRKHISNEVLILCGGKGTRLRSVVSDRPKPMAFVNNKPFIEILISFLNQQGFKKFILAAGYKGKIIKEYFTRKNFDSNIKVIIEKKPLGTGGAVRFAIPSIKNRNFICINGDTFIPLNYRHLLRFHIKNNSIATIVVSDKGKQKETGNIIAAPNGRIISFAEKTKIKNSYQNAGVYVFNKKIFKFIPSNKFISLEKDIFPSLIGKNFRIFKTKKPFLDIGTPNSYKNAEKILKILMADKK